MISSFLVFGRDAVGTYINGVSQEARKRYQFSSLCVRDELDLAKKLYNVARDHGRADLISGETASVMTGGELDRVLGPGGPVAAGYAGYSQLDLAEWDVPGAPTITQRGQRIGRYRCQ